MLSIIFAIILGIGFTFFATQNPGNVLVNFLGSSFAIPTYLFAVLCFLIGAFLAMVFNLFDLVAVAHDRDSRLQNQISTLQNENTRLRNELRGEKLNHTRERVKNFFGKIRHTAA